MYFCKKEKTAMEGKKMTVKEWAEEDKPREKMAAKGRKSLSDAELLSILIRSGGVGEDVVMISKALLEQAGGSFNRLAAMIEAGAIKQKGIGPVKLATIMAAIEIGVRMQHERDARRKGQILSAEDAYQELAADIVDLEHEEFWVLYLNIKGIILYKERLSIGGLTDTTVDPRRIFSKALSLAATSIVVAHNHPSGSLRPSEQDRRLTERLKQAGEILMIKLTDHIIIGITREDGGYEHGFYSFCEHGLL